MYSNYKTDLDQRRIAFCEALIIGGLYTSEIVDRAQDDYRFVMLRSWKSDWQSPKILSRTTIRRYVNAARAKLREPRISSNPNQLAQDAYDRLFQAYRMAQENGDVKNMIFAQKEINRMLGLRKETIVIEVDPDIVREQYKGMVEATTPKKGR